MVRVRGNCYILNKEKSVKTRKIINYIFENVKQLPTEGKG